MGCSSTQFHLVTGLPKYSEEMKVNEATALIRTPLIDWARPQSWCDLGSGRGTFTMALAELLAPGSAIYAVDFDLRALVEIPEHHDGVEIRKVYGDLKSSSLRLRPVDGILMANTLHFIQEQQALVRRLLSVADRFLIVEYERSKSNPGGPYPVGFERLHQLFTEAGAERVEKLATRPSRFGGTMYSAIAERSKA
jgi:ubiquinone/menaquinone biosynthesis C-methylase UbiE